MNDFTREELNLLFDALSDCVNEIDNCSDSIHAVTHSILNKLKSMIDNFRHEEKEIYCCWTGLAVTDDFFCKQQHLDIDHLIPVIHQLSSQCDGIIKNAGLYKFELRLVKLK